MHTLMKGALFATALGLATLYGQANAADLGGNCCADLEERVAELESSTARKGNRKVSVTIYGQVNKAVMWTEGLAGTGFGTRGVIDNSTSPTFFGAKGEGKLSDGWKAGFRLELGINDKPPLLGIVGDPQVNVRHSAFWAEHKVLGRVTVGKTSMATDGIGSISVANTEVASRMLSIAPVSTVFLLGYDLPFNDIRRSLVRYDSASLGGLVLSASYANGETPVGLPGFSARDAWDVSARYATDLSGFRVAAGLGYRKEDYAFGTILGLVPRRDAVWSGSASVMHMGSGIFVNGAFGNVKDETIVLALAPVAGLGADLQAVHIQAGWQKNVFGPGATTLYGEFAELKISSNTGGGDVKPTFWGLGAVQSLDAAAMDLYVAYRNYDLDTITSRDVSTLMTGARIRF